MYLMLSSRNPRKQVSLQFPFCRRGNGRTERLSTLPKVSQLLSVGAGIHAVIALTVKLQWQERGLWLFVSHPSGDPQPTQFQSPSPVFRCQSRPPAWKHSGPHSHSHLRTMYTCTHVHTWEWTCPIPIPELCILRNTTKRGAVSQASFLFIKWNSNIATT